MPFFHPSTGQKESVPPKPDGTLPANVQKKKRGKKRGSAEVKTAAHGFRRPHAIMITPPHEQPMTRSETNFDQIVNACPVLHNAQGSLWVSIDP
jgi:hypothetical protein